MRSYKMKQGEISAGANYDSSAIIIRVTDDYTQAGAVLSVEDALAVIKKLNKAIDTVKAAEGKSDAKVWRGKKEKD